jgi:methionyl-tRNA synthetase
MAASERGDGRKILVAVAWPYANGPRHIGHVAGFGVPSDVFARYHRLRGSSVLMVSGTDEHGTPIMVAADKEGVSPRELVDRNSEVIRRNLLELGLSYDTFTRTTTKNHYRVTQDVFRTLYDKGFIHRQTMQGAFSRATGRTLPDRYIEGTCPHCGFAAARGDQCDNCGRQLDPTDLIDPRSRVDGQPPEFRDTEHFFLDLAAFSGRLREWIERQRHWRPNVRAFSLNLLDELRPRAITRDLDWGVPIPLPGFEHRDDKRIYVWFDAVIGYLSASVEWAQTRGEPDLWREWWQRPDARHSYFMGKDNIVFHAVIWPSMLMGYGAGGDVGAGRAGLQLPYDIVSSEFLTMEGRKFSSSRGVVIYVNDFLERYDPDPLRYFLTAAGPETQDTDFTWAEFVRRNNDELLATWGNLVNRTLTSAHRHFGCVPTSTDPTPADADLLATIAGGFGTVGDLIENARFRAALAEAMRLAGLVNQYVSEQAPWAAIKADRDRAATILHTSLVCVDSLKTLLAPFLPFTSQRVHELLGYEGSLAGPLELREVGHEVDDVHWVLTARHEEAVGRWEPSALPAGQALREPVPLVRKLDAEEVVATELERMERASRAGSGVGGEHV